jgi:hypothetical protein
MTVDISSGISIPESDLVLFDDIIDSFMLRVRASIQRIELMRRESPMRHIGEN